MPTGSRQPIRFLIICHSRLWLDHGITTANQIRNNVPFHDSDWPTKLGAKTPFFINDSIQAHTGTRLADTSPRACPRAHHFTTLIGPQNWGQKRHFSEWLNTGTHKHSITQNLGQKWNTSFPESIRMQKLICICDTGGQKRHFLDYLVILL